MYRTSDSGLTSIYRVNVEFTYRWGARPDSPRERHFGQAAVNVKASSPTAAREWLLSHPYEAKLPGYEWAEVTHAYKLKRQPVWLRKVGKRGARFDIRTLWLGHIEHGSANKAREYSKFGCDMSGKGK